MKKSKKVQNSILYTLLAIFITTCLTILVYQNATKIVEKVAKKQYTRNLTNLKAINYAAKNAKAGGNCEIIKLKDKNNVLSMPTGENGEEIYCIDPKTKVPEGTYTKEDVEKWYEEDLEKWLAGEGDCEEGLQHSKSNDESYHSMTYFECKGEHYSESDTYEDGSSMYDIGFLASWTPKWTDTYGGDETSVEQQQAFWLSKLSKGQSIYSETGTKGGSEGVVLMDIAKNYKKYWEEIIKEGEPSMRPKSAIEYENASGEGSGKRIELYVDEEERMYKIGPFKIDYVNGTYESNEQSGGKSYSFGGISNMYLLDESGNKIKIANLIKIETAPNSETGNKEGKLCPVTYPEEDGTGKTSFFSTYCYPSEEESGYGENYGANKEDPNYMDWAGAGKTYPKPGEEFYVEVSMDETEEMPTTLKLKVEFKFMEAQGSVCIRDGKYYYLKHTIEHDDGDHMSCVIDPELVEDSDPQDVVQVMETSRTLHEEELIIVAGNPEEPDEDDYVVNTPIKIGGYVFLDVLSGKESVADGQKTDADLMLANIEVALFDNETGELATLKTAEEEKTAGGEGAGDEDDYLRRINPTITDENGYYEFRGVEPGKKYYVRFTYNGQLYTATDYMKGCGSIESELANGDEDASEGWKNSSKGTEKNSDRTQLDQKFGQIGSAPYNYPSSNSLGVAQGGYNQAYSLNDLSGIKLNAAGQYEQSDPLIDTFLKVEGGNIVESTELIQGQISKAIRDYVESNKKYPSEGEMKSVYSQIAGDNETWKMLQFVEDSKIYSYTKAQEVDDDYDLYPYNQQYTTYVESGSMYPENSSEDGEYPDLQLNINGTLLPEYSSGSYFCGNSYSNKSGRKFISYKQDHYKDIKWGPYNVSSDGCTLIALADAVSGYIKESGKEIDDDKLVEKILEISNDVVVENGGKKGDLPNPLEVMDRLGKEFNLNFETTTCNTEKQPNFTQITNGRIDGGTSNAQTKQEHIKDIEKTLASGDAVVIHVLGQNFPSGSRQEGCSYNNKFAGNKSNHWMTLVDYNEKEGKVYIQNNSKLTDGSYSQANGVATIGDGWYPIEDVLESLCAYSKISSNNPKPETPTQPSGDGTGPKMYYNIYPEQLYINQGIVRRPQFDVALRKDVYKATLKAKGRTEIYDYDERPENEEYWEIQSRMIDYATYYQFNYNRELYNADVQGTDLEIYVTYKIMVRNQSQSLLAQIDEIVDYYDESYEVQPDKSWIMYNEGEGGSMKVSDEDYYNIMTGEKQIGGAYRDAGITSSQYNGATQFSLPGYQALYISGLQNKKLQTGEQAHVYLTFKVKGQGPTLAIDDPIAQGKQNIAEINGYTSYYADGTTLPNGVTKGSGDLAGIIDKDSCPGNFDAEKLSSQDYEQYFEDDTDRAKGIKIYIDENIQREINGTAWEDKRTKEVEDAVIGNGIKDDGEISIKGITVELFEIAVDEKGNVKKDSNGNVQLQKAKVYEKNDKNGKEAIAITLDDGRYSFKGIPVGDYIVRFSYGANENAKYNGQDYKTTTYQVGISQEGRTDISDPNKYAGYQGYINYNTQNTSGSYGYSIQKTDDNSKQVSDAKDIWSYREAVNKYSSNNNQGVTNNLAVQLNNTNQPNENTKMVAETGAMRLEFEYNRQQSVGSSEKPNEGQKGENAYNGNYTIANVDIGLEERPKAGLELNKKVAHVLITLANKNVLFDTSKTVENFIWKSKTQHSVNDFKKETKYDQKGPKVNDAEANKVYSDYTQYDQFRKAVLEKVSSMATNEGGLLQATMDDEIMHGATIQITYDMSVTNIGETDYKETKFYYLGQVENKNNKVTTSADIVIDYPSNSIEFRAQNNKDWSIVTKEQINKYVDSNVQSELDKCKTIIQTGVFRQALEPGAKTAEKKLILNKTITAQSGDDDLSFGNIAEIVQISNTAGRRMAYSIQGNQSPFTNPTEPDASKAEQVIILPPFGQVYLYIGLAILSIVILGVGIIVIKKTVLNKNKF